MAFLKFLVNIGLIFKAIMALPVNDDSKNIQYIHNRIKDNYRLPHTVIPVHYNIKLTPYIMEHNFNFDGEINITIQICNATQKISLHTLDLTLDKTMTKLIDIYSTIHAPTVHKYKNKTQILTLHFNSKLLPGYYTLRMKYIGFLHENFKGFFRKSYINLEGLHVWLAATSFEPTWARRAFPCWDEPALKATFNISIKHERNYIALSNMPVLMQIGDSKEKDKLWTHFRTTPVMSTYLVAFALVDYVSVRNKDSTINVWCKSELVPHIKLLQEVAEKSQLFMTQYTNISYIVPKMDHVAIPQLNFAVENWGLIAYDEAIFTFDEESNKMKYKHGVASIVAHETAHQWFGNLVTPSWWSYLWLKEGFATFFSYYINNQIFKDWRQMDFFVVDEQQMVFAADIGRNVTAVMSEANSPSKIRKLYSFITYRKGAVITRMLQHIMTDNVFQKGLIKYLHTHKLKSTTDDDLWISMQAALDESEVSHYNYRLKEVMDTWTKQNNYPIVSVTRNYDTGEMIITQHTKHIQNLEDEKQNVDEKKWWIPLTFATQTNPDFSSTVPTHWLKPQDENIIVYGIDPNDWVIFNVQQTGYYIVNYDIENWERIADYLSSDEYTKIHVLNRAQIINDAYLLTVTDQLSVDVFIHLTDFLFKEKDYIALYPILTMLRSLMNYKLNWKYTHFEEHILYLFKLFIEMVKSENIAVDDDFKNLVKMMVLEEECQWTNIECNSTVSINPI